MIRESLFHQTMSSRPVRLLALAASFGACACSRPLVMGDIGVHVEIETTVEDANHAPLEGVLVLFAKGSSSPKVVGRTDGTGYLTGRQTFMWAAPLGAHEPPDPIAFTLIYQRDGYQEVRQLFLVKDLPERNGFKHAETRVVLLEAEQEGAV